MADIKTHTTLATNLVSYWDLEEASGTRYDLHGSKDLTDNNTVGQNTGKIGNCASFDDANSEYLANTSLGSSYQYDGTVNRTVSFWFNADDLSGVNSILGNWNTGGGNQDWLFYTNGTTLTFSARGSTQVTTTVSASTWYHVVGTMNSSGTCELFVDSVSAGTGSAGTGGGSGVTLNIGRNPSNNYYDGLIDELGIWTKVLTQTEIDDLYNGGDSLPYFLPADVKNATDLSTDLVSYWEMEQSAGATATDSHGSNDLADNNTVGTATGILGEGGDYNGSSTYHSIADGSQTDLDISSDFSYSFWFKADSLSGARGIVSKGWPNNGNSNSGYFIALGSSYVELHTANGTSWSSLDIATTFSTATWYHVVVTYDLSGGVAEYFVDGVSIGSVSGGDTTINNSTIDFEVGRLRAGTWHFEGVIDELAMWKKALSTAEVRGLYGYGTPPVYEAIPSPTTQIKGSTLETDLVSYWDLEEASGTRYDLHGVNDLTDNNTVSQGTGKIGNCADFERANSEYLYINDGDQTGLDITGDFSVSTWVNFETVTDSPIFGKYNDSVYRGFAAYMDGSSTLSVRISDDGSARETYSFSWTPSTSTMYHLVLTWDASASEMKLYIDDVQTGGTQTGAMTSIYNHNRPFILGHNQSTGGYMDGLIDEFGIWTKVLTESEITALYNSGDALPYFLPADVKNDTDLSTNLTAYWEFDDNSDSHSTYTLTEQGSPTYTTGKSGNAIDLEDSSSQYVTSTNGFNSTTQSFSVWFKAESLNGSYSPSIISTFDNGNKDGFYMRYNYTDNKLYFELRDTGATARTLTSVSAISAGTWYHIVIAWDTSEGKMYVNGVLEDTELTWGTMDASSNNLYLGNDANYTTRYFDGLIDETAIWSKKLGVDEVRALYGYGTPPIYEASGEPPVIPSTNNALAMCNF